ncbi:protein MgtS [Serratia rubidaea]
MKMGNMTVFLGFLGVISTLGLLAAYLSTKWDD